jgi:hypothetical protein
VSRPASRPGQRHGQRFPDGESPAGLGHLPGRALPEEGRVFPVAGPVTGGHRASTSAADTRELALRTAVRRSIGELNDGR